MCTKHYFRNRKHGHPDIVIGIPHERFKKKSQAYHGWSGHPLYTVWRSMLARCNNPKNPGYPDYGGRGIRVDERWHDLDNFLADVSPSYVQGLSLDRVDNDGNYSRSNFRWATSSQQTSNTRKAIAAARRRQRIASLLATPMTIEEIAAEIGFSVSYVRRVLSDYPEIRAIRGPQRYSHARQRGERIRELRRAGMRPSMIARQLGCSPKTVYRHTVEQKPFIDREAIRRMFTDGMSITDITEAAGCSLPVVYQSTTDLRAEREERERQTVLTMLDAGMPVAQIVAATGWSMSSVYRLRRPRD